LVISLPSAAIPASPTPDQRFVASLKAATAAHGAALSRLKASRPTAALTAKARSDLKTAIGQLKSAAKTAPTAVGVIETPEVRNGLIAATDATISADGALGKRLYDYARGKVTEARSAATEALAVFGVPLKKDFGAFALFRDVSMIQGLEDFVSLNATVRAPIRKIVIGFADRATANWDEGKPVRVESSLAIRKLTVYSIQDPTGGFESGWCKIDTGIIRCNLDPVMKAEERFAVAFGPRMPPGTRMLLKFWATNGKRSYAVVKTR
jgi:hypothetical protein